MLFDNQSFISDSLTFTGEYIFLTNRRNKLL